MHVPVRLPILVAIAILVAALPASAQTPGPPTSISATVNLNRTLTLQWTAPATGGTPTGYIVQVGSAPGGNDLLNDQIGNITTYTTAQDFAPGTRLYVRVRALNASGVSAASTELVVTIVCTPPVERPFALTWRMVTPTTVQLTWVPPSPAPYSDYRVEIGSASGLADVVVVTTGSGNRTFLTVALPGAGTFFARVRGTGGCSGATGPASDEVRIQAGAVSGPSNSIVINEFNGFVELKNISSAPVAVGGWRIQTTTGLDQLGVLSAFIRGGVVMEQGCTYLMAPLSDSTAIPADEPLSVGVNEGVALVRPDGFIVDSAGRRNSFGIANPNTPFIEGNGLRPRRDTTGIASFARVGDVDTNDNANDFIELTTATPQSASGCFLQPPDPPTMLGASVVGSAINLSWQPPSAGSPRTGFIVEIGTTAGGSDVLNQQIGNVTTFQTAPLPTGVYYVRVRAFNGAGLSNPSNEVSVPVNISPNVPGPPRNLVATVNGHDVVLSWSAPASGGAPLLYRLDAGTTPGASNVGTFPLSPVLSSVFFPNVPNGVYYARLYAINAAGTSVASNEVAIVVCDFGCSSPPGPVTNLTFQVSGNNVLLSWNAPTGGAAPTGYVVEAGTATGLSNLGQFPTGSTSAFVIVSGVPPGAYFVRVRAAVDGVLGPASNEVVIFVP